MLVPEPEPVPGACLCCWSRPQHVAAWDQVTDPGNLTGEDMEGLHKRSDHLLPKVWVLLVHVGAHLRVRTVSIAAPDRLRRALRSSVRPASQAYGDLGLGRAHCHARCRARHVGVQGCSELQCSCPEDVSCGSAQRIRACRNDEPDLNSSWDVSGHKGRLHHSLGSLARVLHPRSRLQSRDQPHNIARRWLLLGTTEPCAASRPDMASCCCSVQQQTAARCAPCFG